MNDIKRRERYSWAAPRRQLCLREDEVTCVTASSHRSAIFGSATSETPLVFIGSRRGALQTHPGPLPADTHFAALTYS